MAATDATARRLTTLTAQQLATLRVCGWLALTLYTALALAILWRTALHFRHSSRGAKKLFHLALLAAALMQLPDAVEWIWWPTTAHWEHTYVLRLYALLLQSFCKSYLAVCWAGVVSAGQARQRRRMTTFVALLNALLVLWGMLVPVLLLTSYDDDLYGQYAFMTGAFRGVLTYSGVAVVLAYGLLLCYQGFRLRRRLLLARGTVPAASVDKSLSQLILTVCVFIFSDVVRIMALILNESVVALPMTMYLVLYNLIPNIFPSICMLYLMRRLSGPGRHAGGSHSKSSTRKLFARRRHTDTASSKYMTEGDSSDDRSSSASSDSDSAGRTFVLPSRRTGALTMTRIELQAQQEQLECQHQYELQLQRERMLPPSSAHDAPLSPTQSPSFCWLRESTEQR